MKHESVLRLVNVAHNLILCPELNGENVEKSTREKVESLIEAMGDVEREWKLPPREKMIEYFAEKYAAEDKETLVRRVMALISTLPDNAISIAYREDTSTIPE